MPTDPLQSESLTRQLAIGVGILAATFAFYLPATQCDYIWDDDDYVIENSTLRSAEGLKQIWSQVGATPQYYPMVHTTYWPFSSGNYSSSLRCPGACWQDYCLPCTRFT